MITVLQFIHGLNTGGAETLVKNYALGLDKSRFDVTVLCISHYTDSPYEKQLRDHGIKVIYICDYMKNFGKKGLFYKFWNHYEIFFQVRKWIHKLDPDVIHIHLTLNKYVKFAKPKKDTHIVYTQHFDVKRWEGSYQYDIKCLRWLTEHYLVHLIVLHQNMKQQVNRLFPHNEPIILNNGIDFKAYQLPINRIGKRRELQIPTDAFVVAHVGRFAAIKNHSFLVKVFQEIKRKKENAFLLMVGSGEEEKNIILELENLHLQDNYLILHNRQDIPDILKAADAAIFPSWSEGIPLSLIEMQAAGLPIVASNGISKDARISNLVQFMSLKEAPIKWAETLLQKVELAEPVKYYEVQQWDLSESIKQLEKIYENKDLK